MAHCSERQKYRPELQVFPKDPADFTDQDLVRLENLIRYTYLEKGGLYSGHIPPARKRLRNALGLYRPENLLSSAIMVLEEVQKVRFNRKREKKLLAGSRQGTMSRVASSDIKAIEPEK